MPRSRQAESVKSERRRAVLGEAWSTANYRLNRDLLYHYVQLTGVRCWHCGKHMPRDDFTIEHKVNWLNHPEGKRLFSDPDNITFSHSLCNTENSSAQDRRNRIPHNIKYEGE